MRKDLYHNLTVVAGAPKIRFMTVTNVFVNEECCQPLTVDASVPMIKKKTDFVFVFVKRD